MQCFEMGWYGGICWMNLHGVFASCLARVGWAVSWRGEGDGQ